MQMDSIDRCRDVEESSYHSSRVMMVLMATMAQKKEMPNVAKDSMIRALRCDSILMQLVNPKAC